MCVCQLTVILCNCVKVVHLGSWFSGVILSLVYTSWAMNSQSPVKWTSCPRKPSLSLSVLFQGSSTSGFHAVGWETGSTKSGTCIFSAFVEITNVRNFSEGYGLDSKAWRRCR